jgi:AcrR family transcriptional regulator
MAESTSIRDRTRQAVREELIAVALDLFAAHGYEATTVDEIAAAAGISRRTFFRYFATKDDVVLGKFDVLSDDIADAFNARPSDEPLWTSLRRAFDVTTKYFDDPTLRARSETIERILAGAPGLVAANTQRVARSQEQLVAAAAKRVDGEPANAELQARVLVGAAFACLSAARSTWSRPSKKRPFAEVLDDAMATISPTPASPPV